MKVNYLKKILKAIHTTCVWPVLALPESAYLRAARQPQKPPLFIIGPPRCGSTLLYQLITSGFKVSYFTNLMVYFASSPVLAVRWFAKNCDPPRKFESWYGITRGLSAPNQAPEIWERWFEPGQKYAGPGSLYVNRSNELRATIAHLEEVFEAPFVNKWQGHAVHIRPLVEALPNLLFIRVKRDPLQVAQSILKGRMELRGTQNSWTSVRPSGYQRIADKSPIEQVCGQIYYVERDMDRDSEETGIDRFFEVDYRRICTEPKAVLRDIREFYERRSGYSLRERYMVPDSFPYSDSQKVGESDMRALDSCLRRLQSVGAE